jgi:hypothetical protein
MVIITPTADEISIDKARTSFRNALNFAFTPPGEGEQQLTLGTKPNFNIYKGRKDFENQIKDFYKKL